MTTRTDLGALAGSSPRALRWLGGLATAIAAVLLGWLSSGTRMGDGLNRISYDTLHVLTGLGGADSRVTIVYLDLPSHRTLGCDPARPWPRIWHARLVERLTRAGAAAVVFDVVFDGAGVDPLADVALAAAFRTNGRVVLAGELANASQRSGEGEWGRTSSVLLPYQPLLTNAAGWGLGELAVDEDFTVRRNFNASGDLGAVSLSTATGRILRLAGTRPGDTGSDRWLRYYGPPFTVPHAGFAQALNSNEISDEFFRGKIVLVGARPWAGILKERRDEFRSPFRSWGQQDLFMPGVEVHATQVLNLVRDDGLSRLPRGVEQILLGLAGVLAAAGLALLRPVAASVAALAGGLAVAGVSAWSFSRHGIWFPWLTVVALQIPVAWAGSGLAHSVEWYRTRRRLEAARKIAEARIREQAALIDKAHDAILVEDLAGRIVYANSRAERLYGWDLAALQQAGTTADLFALDGPKVLEARSTARRRGEWNGELRLATRPGQTLIVDSRWTLIRDDDGQPKALLIINSDITEKKQLEIEVNRSQRMETIGSLAGGMAHDLNNALAPVLMGTQLLRGRLEDPDDRRLLNLMESSTQRGVDMLRHILLFVRGREGEFAPVAVGPLVREVEKMVRDTFPRTITVEAYAPPDLWSIRGNATQLHQILLNLCVNARDAMVTGGKLTLAVDNVELAPNEEPLPADAPAGAYVSLMVSDTGSGMSPETRARIFEPFFTTKGEGEGTGLGLATVVRLVKKHGGFLRVESEPGRGTTFEIFIPRAAGTTPRPAAPGTEVAPGRGELILVAGPEQAIRDLVGEGLVAHGHRMLAAANGAEARELLRQHAAELRLCFADASLSGPESAALISARREYCPHLPLVVASGEADESLTAFLTAGATRLPKPFALIEVLGVVHQAMNAPGGGPKNGATIT